MQNDWLRGQQKSTDRACDYLPSLFCVPLLLGFVSVLNGKTPIFIYDFEAPKNGLWVAKKPDKSGFLPGTSFSYPFDGISQHYRFFISADYLLPDMELQQKEQLQTQDQHEHADHQKRYVHQKQKAHPAYLLPQGKTPHQYGHSIFAGF